MFLFLKRFFYFWFPGNTIGARIILQDDNRIFFVKHKYHKKFLYFPGGGMKYGELPIDCVIREIKEEIGLDLSGEKEKIKLFGVYNNIAENKNDYIFLFIANINDLNIKSVDVKIKSFELAEIFWYTIDNLPLSLSPGTKRRIQEYLSSPTEIIMNKW